MASDFSTISMYIPNPALMQLKHDIALEKIHALLSTMQRIPVYSDEQFNTLINAMRLNTEDNPMVAYLTNELLPLAYVTEEGEIIHDNETNEPLGLSFVIKGGSQLIESIRRRNNEYLLYPLFELRSLNKYTDQHVFDHDFKCFFMKRIK